MRDVRDIISTGFKHGAGTVVGFAVGALLVTFVRDPIERFVIPRAMAMWGDAQVMEMYWPEENQTSFVKADSVMSVYWPMSSDELSGRIIVRDAKGKDSMDAQSVLNGFRQNDVLSFTYRTVADGRAGIGAFFGTLDPVSKIYVGTVTGFMHDEKKPGIEQRCSIETAIAVLGDPSKQEAFLEEANAALKLKLDAIQAKKDDGSKAAPFESKKVACETEETATAAH